jgi:uncharacterized protein
MQRRRLLSGIAACTVATRAWAQVDWRRVAVPLYSPQDFVNGFFRAYALPRAQAWQASCATLVRTLASSARPASDARAALRATVLDWAALSALATGPLVSRRSARRVDFQPVRTALVLRAVEAAPAGAEAMERIGSAAKGMGALEWLLWAPAAPQHDAAKAFALETARDLQREADAVAEGFAALAERDLDEESVVASFAEILNQWIGGVEQLRMQRLVRPVEEARTGGARSPLLLRPWSGVDAEERAVRWRALQAAAVFAGGTAPPRGHGQLVTIETYLRGRGLNHLADRLRAVAASADRALRAAGADRPASMLLAAQYLSKAKHLAEADLAPALEVRVGFSDADGD